MSDVELVFYNCRLYNPPESEVIIMCNHVYSTYRAQAQQLGLDKHLSKADH